MRKFFAFLKRKRFFLGIYVFLSFGTLLIYATAYISPAHFPFMGFFAGVIPFLLILHVFLFLACLRYTPRYAWISVGVLIMGWSFVRASIALGGWFGHKEQQSLQILSYNVRVFNIYTHLQREKPGSSQKMIQWLSEHPAEVKCFQEFYHSKTDSAFNTFLKIGRSKGYTSQIVYEESLQWNDQYFGVAIFSKLPVVSSGDFHLNKPWTQRGVYMDVIWQKDTLRIINVHLQSLSLDDKSLFEWRNLRSARRAYARAYHKLREGFQKRAQQLGYLEKFIALSPYKIILCGDFNDPPYSYTYQRLKKYFHNAFENGGSGLGFTYNGKIPFLRIDNQFYSPGINIQSFEELYEYEESDHFPVLGSYKLK